jgi:hypothetical protein
MKEIPLTQGKVALVDDEDFDRISCHKWTAARNGYTWYAVRMPSRKLGPRRHIYMHNEIMEGLGVDHRNRNGLDNTRTNLRFASGSQNRANSKLRTNNTSGNPGVWWNNNKWQAGISVRSRSIHLGSFADKITAAHARRQAELAYFGEFAP